MSRNGVRPGDKAALLALLGMLVIFAFVVGRGWHVLASSYGAVVSFPVGIVMASIAIALCYGIAAERVHNVESKAAAIGFFFFLVNISALGALNAMFVMFQGTNVFREEIAKANEAIVAMRDVGAPAVKTVEYDRWRADVSEKWRNLKAELENPQLCGQGPMAAQRIAELQVILPSFRALAGSGRCDKVPAVIAAYDKQIADLEGESPVYQNAKKRLELRKRIQSGADELLEDLNDVRKGLSGLYDLPTTKAKLFDVAERYGQMRQELTSAGVTGIDKVPARIDTRTISALGDIGQVIPFVLGRLGEISTYIYLFLAVVLDLAIIAGFTRVLRVGPKQSTIRFAGGLRKI